jgi:hypothetical protein
MNQNFNILRLCCLIQDRDAQDLKRTVLSIVFEILYENNNDYVHADNLFDLTNDKFNTSIDKDFFDNLLLKSTSFELLNTNDSPLVKLTKEKYNEIDKNVSEYSIEPHIERFLDQKGFGLKNKEKILEILFQSIYENIYTFKPDKIKTIIPQHISNKLSQEDLDIFNQFLEFDEPSKNRCLYNHFAKAIEFAILTSGKGVSQFSENLYKDKRYLLDTNIIFRLIGVGGTERQWTIKSLMLECLKQGISFEYSHQTLFELNKKLEQCVIEIQRAEKSRKIEIIEDVLEKNPHLFNDDFITQYCKLRLDKVVNSPEQYEIEMKSRFKTLCKELKIVQANNDIKIEDSEKNMLALSLIHRRKEINEYYRYSLNQAKVDAYNVLYVKKSRGHNNYNYADVKSFYLTTDRGLNKILSNDKNVLVPETILPSQLFVIHNPISSHSDKDPDYKTFFRFLKRRTSEFKFRGKDVINYINQARIYTSDSTAISSLIEAYSDQRYKYSISETIQEGMLISFRDFTHTFFDKKNEELKDIKENYDQIKYEGVASQSAAIRLSNIWARVIDFIITFMIIPGIAIAIKLIGKIDIWILLLIIGIAELLKFILSTRTRFLKLIWKSIFKYLLSRSPYFKLTKDVKILEQGLNKIDQMPDNIWK